MGIEVEVGATDSVDFSSGDYFGILLQFPTSDGRVVDYAPLASAAHEHGTQVIAAADPLSLVLLEAPGRWGADIVGYEIREDFANRARPSASACPWASEVRTPDTWRPGTTTSA